MNLAESAYQAKKYAEVDKLLAPLIAEGSKAESSLVQSALYRRAWTRFKQAKYAEAIKTIDRLLAEHPDNPFVREAKYLRAESLFQSGDVKTALAAFAALSEEPAPTTTRRRPGSILSPSAAFNASLVLSVGPTRSDWRPL